jgi:hypothetical protein
MALYGYGADWRNFACCISEAQVGAHVNGLSVASLFVELTEKASGRPRQDFHLSRYAAYLTAMEGDTRKPEIAAAKHYFAVRTQEAELGAITEAEKRDTALARAREMIDYRIFRDMVRENATDYVPSSKETQVFFGAMQNRLYRHLTGMDAKRIMRARALYHWPGREEGKGEPGPKSKDRKIAKNYLTCEELKKLDLLVARLCLRAQFIAEDNVRLTTGQWAYLVDEELALLARPLAA